MDTDRERDTMPSRLFSEVRGEHGMKFRQALPEGQAGEQLVLEHDGHDHVVLDMRERYRDDTGRLGDRRAAMMPLNSEEAVNFASVLLYLVDEHLRNSDEQPFYRIVTTRDRAALGPNWLVEDRETACPRLARRRARSHVLGLVQRCLEVCEDEAFVREITVNLAVWARRSDDAFALQKAEQALFQMDMVPAGARQS